MRCASIMLSARNSLKSMKDPPFTFSTTLVGIGGRAGDMIRAVALGVVVAGIGGANKAESDGRVRAPMGKGRVMGVVVADGGKFPLPAISGTDAMTEAGGRISIGWLSVVSGSVSLTVGEKGRKGE